MNILFLSLSDYKTMNIRGIYADLLNRFIAHKHNLYIISPFERSSVENERVIEENGVKIVKIKIWNMQKTNIIEKGISMLTIDRIFIRAIQKYFSNVNFDLVLYPTPPITLLKAVEYVKKRDDSQTYLLLKDIFPQNAVDIGLMSTSGLRGLPYKYFRMQEKRLYIISDKIGCMSQANVDYLLKHNPEIDASKVEVCPNSTDIEDKSVDEATRKAIREKYNIPLDKKVFVYGGNLGKPQGVPFLIECLKAVKDVEGAYFLVVGDGTEYRKLEEYSSSANQNNFKLMKRLPKNDYDIMVGACDIGMIFLDHRFTIPNFPSRLLSYMSAKLPVLAVTDRNTDVGRVVVEGGFGWWCESKDAKEFVKIVTKAVSTDTSDMTEAEFQFLIDNYSSSRAYDIICKSLKWE